MSERTKTMVCMTLVQEPGPSIHVVECDSNSARLLSFTDLFEAANRARIHKFGITQLIVGVSGRDVDLRWCTERIEEELERVKLPGESWVVDIKIYKKHRTEKNEYCVVNFARTFVFQNP